MSVAFVALRWIIEGTACAVAYDLFVIGGHTGLNEGWSEYVVHSTLDWVSRRWRVL